jgi:hypothetical protein
MPQHVHMRNHEALLLLSSVSPNITLDSGAMDAYQEFLRARKKDLQRIAHCTQGEHQYEDVAQEAWTLAVDLAGERNIPLDFRDDGFQGLLLSHLFQHLVRYTETTVRYAKRLDHSPAKDASEGTQHPLLHKLAGREEDDPLAQWLAAEEDAKQDAKRHSTMPFSLAAAYVLLLRRFDDRMHSLARHLLISLSYAYRSCAKARRLAVYQHALAFTTPETTSALKPWRKQRALRIPRQLAFNFEERLFLDANA